MAKKKRRTTRPPTPDPAPLSRQTYDLYWLEVEDKSQADRAFAEQKAVESDGIRATIEPFLAEALHDHHTPRQRVAQVLADLGYAGAAEYFSQELPKADRTRKGNFGEVVASEHLSQRHGYSMPVFKLRHRDSGLPMRGEDIVAFEVNGEGEIVRVIIGEAKAVKRFKKATVREAHERLKVAYQPRPKTLAMLSNILYDRGDNALAAQIDRISATLPKRQFPCSHWIFIINETQPEDPFAVLAEDGELIDELSCIGVALPELTDLVDALFDAGPVPPEENE